MLHKTISENEIARWLLRLASGPNPRKLNAECPIFSEVEHFLPQYDWDEWTTFKWYSQIWHGLKRLTNKWKRHRHWKVRIGVYHTSVMGYRNRKLTILPKKEEPSLTDVVAERVYRAMRLLEKRLRRCASSRCNKFFIGIKRQRYCTRKCGVGARVRKHRRKKSFQLNA